MYDICSAYIQSEILHIEKYGSEFPEIEINELKTAQNTINAVFLNYTSSGGGGQFNILGLHYNFNPLVVDKLYDHAYSRYTDSLIEYCKARDNQDELKLMQEVRKRVTI